MKILARIESDDRAEFSMLVRKYEESKNALEKYLYEERIAFLLKEEKAVSGN